ncbi:MAG: Fic family protein [Nitrosotalea sp.]
MVSVIKRVKKGNPYYYLKHDDGKVQRETYLGTAIPKDILQIKREFLLQIQRDTLVPLLDEIKNGYLEYLKKTPKTIIRQNLVEFSYYFTYDTQKIEGSSLTRKETYNLLQFHITPANKPESDMIEAQKHQEVFMHIMESRKDISLESVLRWHHDMFSKTKPEFAGKIRDFPVFIGGSKSTFPNAKFLPALLKEFFKWYGKTKGNINPVELAALAHFRFVTIHPFGDGNGRISRLLMNHVLHKNGYPLFNIRFDQRLAYYISLEKAATRHEEIYFLKWFLKKYVASNRHFSKP